MNIHQTECYLHSSVFFVRTECAAIQAVRDAVTRHPLVRVLSTLSHQTSYSRSANQSDLYPLVPVVLSSRPRPTVAFCRDRIEPCSISTVVLVPLC